MASKKKASSTKSKTTKAVEITPVRYSALPKITAPTGLTAATVKRTVSIEEIARKAYELYASGTGGSEFDNWVRAEKELKAA